MSGISGYFSFSYSESVELYYKPTGRIIAVCSDGIERSIVFFAGAKHIHDAMKIMGTQIPLERRKEFASRRFVKLDDPEFGRAFLEIHYRCRIDHDKFKWRLKLRSS